MSPTARSGPLGDHDDNDDDGLSTDARAYVVLYIIVRARDSRVIDTRRVAFAGSE